MSKKCIHRRRFRACYRGKGRARSGIYCADCGTKLNGEGQVSQKELASVADLYRRTDQPKDQPSDAGLDEFSLE